MGRHGTLSPNEVEPLLHGRFGRPYLWSESCASTQDVLRDSDLPEGAVAVTEHQTAGRGRKGRRWTDAAGASVLLSVLLRPPAGSPAQQLSLVAGLAVAEAVEETTNGAAEVKWPNDVLLAGRKVAGVLLEATAGAVVCGIGVNVSQGERELPAGLAVPAGSLRSTTGRAPDRAELLVALLRRFERGYETWLAGGLTPLLPELEARNALRGRRVLAGGAEGVAGSIAPDGRLTLQHDDGTVTLVASGEVRRLGRG